MTPIFTDEFLKPHLANFRLASVPGIRQITKLIKAWLRESESGKLQGLKEEEVKSRFINNFFGDILGFAYGTSQYWHLSEEKKSKVDGTKPDAALGYFGSDEDTVRVVVEMKDFSNDLDAKQKRPGKLTAIDQAFNYAPKMGGECKWVIVSNLNEIRFYSASDRSKYQKFTISDLIDENRLKEFLLLFHRDRFIKRDSKSQTDKLLERSKVFEDQPESTYHIIDELFVSLKRFEGLTFVDPNYIASINPFNIQEEYVWHYNYHSLFTVNPKVYHLLSGLEIKPGEIRISDALKAEITDKNVLEADFKISWIFNFLNCSLINQIKAVRAYEEVETRNKHAIGFSVRHSFNFKEGEEGITKDVWIRASDECDCLICNFRALNFKKIAEKLRMADGNPTNVTMEYAYGHYLMGTQNYKTAYTIYKSLEESLKGEEGREVEYFLVKYNLLRLHNLVSDYGLEDGVEILKNIKSIDLNRVLYDELAFEIDEDVRTYLVKVKEDDLVFKVQDEIDENLQEIKKLRALYENGGTYTGPNYPTLLMHAYSKLVNHINQNFLIYDKFSRYKDLTSRVLEGLIDSYLTPKAGINQFTEFILSEAVLHTDSQRLEKLLSQLPSIEVTDAVVPALLEKLKNILNSYATKGIMGRAHKLSLLQEFLQNYGFKYRFCNIFHNVILVLSKLDISDEQFQGAKNLLIDFIEIEDELSWLEIKQLGKFIECHYKLFSIEELTRYLEIGIQRDRVHYHKYSYLIKSVTSAIKQGFPDQLLSSSRLVEIAVINNFSENSVGHSLREITCLLDIFDEKSIQPLVNKLDFLLQEKFSIDLYEEAVRTRLAHHFLNDFSSYVEAVNKSKGRHTYSYGQLELTDVVFINFIITAYFLDQDLNKYEDYFDDLNSFEKWLLNPTKLDLFESRWLIDVNFPVILTRLTNISGIAAALDKHLERDFNETLAKIRYTYFKEASKN